MKKSMIFLTYVLMGYSVTMFCAAPASSRPSASGGSLMGINRPRPDLSGVECAIVALACNEDYDPLDVQENTRAAARLWQLVGVRKRLVHHDIQISRPTASTHNIRAATTKLTTVIASILVSHDQCSKISEFIDQNIGRCVVPVRGKIDAQDLVAAIRPVLLGALALKATLSPASNEKHNYGFEPDVMDTILNISIQLESKKNFHMQDMARLEQYKQKVLHTRDVKPSLSEAVLREIDMIAKMRASLLESAKAHIGLLFTMLFRADNQKQIDAVFAKTDEKLLKLFTKVPDVMALHDDLVANYDRGTLDENMCNVVHDALLDAEKDIASFHEKLRAQYRSFIHATR